MVVYSGRALLIQTSALRNARKGSLRQCARCFERTVKGALLTNLLFVIDTLSQWAV